MQEKPRDTSVSTVSLSEDGIILVRIKQNIVQTMEAAIENIKVCTELADGVRRPLLLDLRQAQPLTPDIRQFYASREVGGHFSAIAILVEGSFFGRAIGNFYLSVARTGLAKQLFDDESSSLTWLRKFIRE